MILTTGMEHPRTLIREAVVALLIGANTAAGPRVDDTRVELMKTARLPAISVRTTRDVIDRDASETSSPRELVREAKVEIEAWVAHSAAVPVAKAMDRIAKQIEDAMSADPEIGGVASDSILDDTDLDVLEDDQSHTLIGLVTLTYSVTYRTSAIASEDLDDFRSVDAKHRIVGAVEANQGRDEFVVQETP